MTHSSLLRVIVFVPALSWACAQQVDDFPEQLEGDDAQAVGKAGSSATGGSGLEMHGPTATGGSANVVQAGGASTGGTRSYTPTGGQSNKAGAGGGGGAGSSVALPPSEEGGAATEQGGAAGADAGSGGGDTGGSAGHAGSASGGSASAGSSSGGSGSVGACSGVAKWSAGTYAAGARVQNGVNLYQCKPHPYSGWCGLEAYAPGSGWAWTDAWTLVGPC